MNTISLSFKFPSACHIAHNSNIDLFDYEAWETSLAEIKKFFEHYAKATISKGSVKCFDDVGYVLFYNTEDHRDFFKFLSHFLYDVIDSNENYSHITHIEHTLVSNSDAYRYAEEILFDTEVYISFDNLGVSQNIA